MILCRHCEKAKAQPNRRGLCCRCHANLAIREQYPADSREGKPGPERRDETLADLEAMIAERLKNKPAWWDRSMPNKEKRT